MKSLIAIVFLICGGLTAQADTAAVNGIKMYYEIHGPDSGTPLVLLPGGGSTVDSTFGRILPELAKKRKVIALEEQAHGRTTDRNAPLRFETSAEDVVALLNHLKIKQADLFGFSNGASIALEVAIRHPDKVRKLIFASAMTKRSGTAPALWEYLKKANFENMPQPLKDAFLRVTPDPAKLKVMHDKDLERIRNFKDVPDSQVKSVKADVMLLSGDKDVPTLQHLAELAKLLPKSTVVVLPGGHGDYLGEIVAPPQPELVSATAAIVDNFLSKP